MRCIAQYREYKVGLRSGRSMVLATGDRQIVRHDFVAEFRQYGATPAEREMARARFEFRGMYQEEDEATPIDPITGINSRLSVFDTDDPELVARWAEWDDVEGKEPGTIKAEVEERLRKLAGIDFFVVEAAKLAPPWPNYDKLRAAEKIATKVAEDGYDPQAVIAYERQERDRADVIAALEALGVPEPGEELVAA